MTAKFLATGLAAVAVIGAAADGAASHPAVFQVQPVALESPLPLDPPPPPPGLPTADQLSSLCAQVTDPGVSYTTKTSMVQGGISPEEGHVADHDLRKAYRDGKFPESFTVTNIQPAGPNAATADVAISGPKFAGPVTKHLLFVNEDGNWVLSHDSALALLQASTA
ncbi:hypothetical protein MSM1_01815 [Mycobacterium sp. SM1]|uniref:hypothetical protein n=1 Tax=Mycobacterium sp. SM1 TaxID=2816243 RepID=UPI001BD11658|nr:hypothetical protein [Mycobacterium sp. SM1]MBS4727154.1 hypothetical protein [Mycobacterium sp. SM1]